MDDQGEQQGQEAFYDTSDGGDELEDMVQVISDDENGVLEDEIKELDIQDVSEEEGDKQDAEAFTPLRDDATVCFKEHSGSVFSVSVHPSGDLACSGGEDDKAFVWKISDGSVVFECLGHKDSVTCTGFSHDGKYLATADMGGMVQVWLTTTGKLAWSFETGDIEWLRWHSKAHVLLVGNNDGSGWMWKIPSGECKTFQGENFRNSCSQLMNDGKRICFGYENGVITIFDMKEGTSLVSLTAASQRHAGPVTCLDGHDDNTLLLSGSEDGTAKLINTNTGKVLTVFQAGFPRKQQTQPTNTNTEEKDDESDQPHQTSESESVEAVGFSSVLPVAVTGSLTSVLGVWDLPTQKLRQKCVHESFDGSYNPGVVRLHCSQHTPLVYTGSLDGTMRGWDLRTGQLVREWHGHTHHILDIAILGDETMLFSASNDHTVRVFNNPLIQTESGHT